MSQTIHPYERVRVADAPPRSINELFFSPPASDVGNVGTRMFKVANVDGGEGTFSNLKMAWGLYSRTASTVTERQWPGAARSLASGTAGSQRPGQVRARPGPGSSVASLACPRLDSEVESEPPHAPPPPPQGCLRTRQVASEGPGPHGCLQLTPLAAGTPAGPPRQAGDGAGATTLLARRAAAGRGPVAVHSKRRRPCTRSSLRVRVRVGHLGLTVGCGNRRILRCLPVPVGARLVSETLNTTAPRRSPAGFHRPQHANPGLQLASCQLGLGRPNPIALWQ